MLASHRLKALGARRVNDVVEFYGNTAALLPKSVEPFPSPAI
ncbi:hypothetical protein [Vibrio mediterranei]|nr:hypothetical protein [Vibrio mediterranei]